MTYIYYELFEHNLMLVLKTDEHKRRYMLGEEHEFFSALADFINTFDIDEYELINIGGND